MQHKHAIMIMLFFVYLASTLNAAPLSVYPPVPFTQTVTPGGPPGTISDAGAAGGTGSYTYQWLEYNPNTGRYSTATDCGPGNAPSTGTVTACTFTATTSTPTGAYSFELQVNDGATTITSYVASINVSFLATPYSAFQQWLPVIIAALFLGFMIASLIYIGGSLMGNEKIKSMGLHEYGQVIGTLVMTLAIIFVFTFLGSATVAYLTATSIGPGIDQICTQNLLATNVAGAPQNPISILSGPPTGPYTTPGTVCNLEHTAYTKAQSGSALADITPYLDYNIVASYVVIANLTNQTLDNLNSLYVYEGLTGFLSSLQAETGICEPGPACVFPLVKDFDSYLLYTPLAGYSMLNSITSPAETQAVFIFYMFMLQLLAAQMFIFGWPYLLAAGIILRSIVFTRKVGGLLMGVAVVAVAIFPLLFMIEYSALQGGGSSLPIIGTDPSQLPNMALAGKDYNMQISGNTCIPQSSGDWNSACPINYDTGAINFFVLPKIKFILFNDGCWPTYANPLPPIGDGHRHATDLLGEESYDSAVYLIPFWALGAAGGALFGVFPNSIPLSPTMCQPDNAIKSAFDLTNVYGIIAIVGYVLPLLNVLIAISAVKNVSALFGGETDLIGIGRLV